MTGLALPAESTSTAELIRRSADPCMCMDAFNSHWRQIQNVLSSYQVARAVHGRKTSASVPTSDDPNNDHSHLDIVLNNAFSLVHLLANEPPPPPPDAESANQSGPMLSLALSTGMFERVVDWCATNCGDKADHVKVQLLNNFRTIIENGRQRILSHEKIARALYRVFTDCRAFRSTAVENVLVKVLLKLSCLLQRDLHTFQLFVNFGIGQGQPDFLLLTLLLPYLHCDEEIGENSRKAVYLLLSTASVDPKLVRFISEKSNFCSILATGISATYASLPSVLPDQYQSLPLVSLEDEQEIPGVFAFVRAVQFCNSLCNVSHKLIRENIRDFILAGFLCPVMLPAISQSSPAEVTAATAYLDVFVRTISENCLVKCTVHFLLTTKLEGATVLQHIIRRINGDSASVSLASLCLINTLVSLKCEDLMLDLFLRYLIPCEHIMKSQRSSISDPDVYGRSVERFLTLIPSACKKSRHKPLVLDKNTGKPFNDDSDASRISSGSFAEKKGGDGRNAGRSQAGGLTRNLSGPLKRDSGINRPGLGEDSEVVTLAQFETRYFEYLQDARSAILACSAATCDWSSPYDGSVTTDVIVRSPRVSRRDDSPDMRKNVLRGALSKSESKDDISPEEFIENFTLENLTSSPRKVNYFTREMLLTEEHVIEEIDLFLSDPFIQSIQCRSLDSWSPAEKKLQPPDIVMDTRDVNHKMAPLSFLNLESLEKYEVQPSPDVAWSPVSEASLASPGSVTKRLPPPASLHDKLTELRPRSASLLSLDENSTSAGKPRTFNPRNNFSSKPNCLHSSPVHSPSHAYIGPAMTALLSKLESMVENDLNTNLILTGIISNLASYPLPLLKSYLLSSSLVFQPNVRTLFNVLVKVQQILDRESSKIDNFNELLIRGRYYLANMDTLRESYEEFVNGECGAASSSVQLGLEAASSKKKITDLFRWPRTGFRRRKSDSADVQVHYKCAENIRYEQESIRQRNIVFSVIVFEEFLKELAALSQEHSVSSADQFPALNFSLVPPSIPAAISESTSLDGICFQAMSQSDSF